MENSHSNWHLELVSKVLHLAEEVLQVLHPWMAESQSAVQVHYLDLKEVRNLLA